MPSAIDVPMFGEVEVPADGFAAMDGGTHGCVGHTVTVAPDGSATWERRLDSMGDPDDCSGSGATTLSADELAECSALAEAVWEYAGRPPSTEREPESFEVPHRMWAIAMRREEEVRVLDGPPFGFPWDDDPAEPGALLGWMSRKVDAWCSAQRGT